LLLLLLCAGIVVHAELVERTLLGGLLIKSKLIIATAIHWLLPHLVVVKTTLEATHAAHRLLLLLIAAWLLGSAELPILLLLLHWLLSKLIERITTTH
jgi:hypothetical protein